MTTGQVFSEQTRCLRNRLICGPGCVVVRVCIRLWAIKYGVNDADTTCVTRPLTYSRRSRVQSRPSGLPRSAGLSIPSGGRSCSRRDLGLTKLYNLVNDPDIADAVDTDVARMREIHVELDHAVMDAYGWDDVPLDHGFHTYRQMSRWTVSPAARVEILDRLLEENHRGPPPRARRRRRPTTRTRGTTNDHARPRQTAPSRPSIGSRTSRTAGRGRPGRTWSTSWSASCSAR